MKKEKSPSNQIIVALDTQDLRKAKRLVKALHKVVQYFKVGSELFSACGPDAVKAVRWAGGHVFLDLKFHDIPNTVAGAVRSATLHNVAMITLHTQGGRAMMEAARQALEESCKKRKVKRRPKLLGVTILTSMSEIEMQQTMSVRNSLNETVLHLTKSAEDAGMDGVVASGRELSLIRERFGRDLLVVTPGIRPEWSIQGDQSRIMTPRKAIQLGADYLVIGRPITEARDPKEAAQRVLEEISS